MRGAMTLACLILCLCASATAAPMPEDWREPNGAEPLSWRSGERDVPPCEGAVRRLRPIWLAAARDTGVKWQVLAAITKVESGFGCNMGPSSAGALGWTQFIPSTWQRWGVDADGDGKAEPSNAVDAVYATARYLAVSGAPKSYRKAIFAYNHADWYVRRVLETAETFGSFSAEEFEEVSAFSAEGQALKLRIEATEDRIRAARRREREVLEEVRTGQARYATVRRDARSAMRRFERSRRRLDDATSAYVGLADGLAASNEMPSGDESVLSYAADARAQDAVLVYQSAGSLLDVRAVAMRRLREAAVDHGRDRDRARRLLLRSEDAMRARVERLLEAQTVRAKRSRALRRLRRDERIYRRTLATWARRYGAQLGRGSLLDNPFVGALGDLDSARRMVMIARAELAWGVKEEPMGSNDSADIARYRSAVPGGMVGPWCAYFISYLAVRAGTPLGPDGDGYARVDDMAAYARRHDEWIADVGEARPGDLIFFPQHVGIVERVVGRRIVTIEGNSSDAVVRRNDRQRGAVGLWRVGRRSR